MQVKHTVLCIACRIKSIFNILAGPVPVNGTYEKARLSVAGSLAFSAPSYAHQILTAKAIHEGTFLKFCPNFKRSVLSKRILPWTGFAFIGRFLTFPDFAACKYMAKQHVLMPMRQSRKKNRHIVFTPSPSNHTADTGKTILQSQSPAVSVTWALLGPKAKKTPSALGSFSRPKLPL